MPEYQTKEDINKFWDLKEYNYCIKVIRKGLRNLKFDILKVNGKPTEEKVFLKIWIDDRDEKLEKWNDY